MNIAVFGWYHHQNAGDDRMQQCLTRWLDGHTLAFLPAGRPPPIELLRTFDAAIIGGGGLIQKRGALFRDMARWVRKAGIPVAIAGASIEKMNGALRRELRDFMDHASFVWLRDQGSLDAVGPHPNAFVAPDITWLYPHEPSPASDVDMGSVAVSLRAERGLDVEGWRDVLSSLEADLRPWPLYFEQGGDRTLLDDLLPGDRLPGDRPSGRGTPSEFDLAPVRAARAVIAGRFHAAIFALQLGKPFIAVSTRPKTKRFLAEHGLETWCVAEDRPQDLAALWPRFLDQSDALAEQARAIARTLHDEVWTRTEAARARLLESAAALPPPRRRRGLGRLLSVLPGR